MGYTTDFTGSFGLNKELSPKMKMYLDKFNETRRMRRTLDSVFGIEGEFYVFGGGDFGQDREENIVDFNKPSTTQAGLWCQWKPSEDGTQIEWDGAEKFYNYTEWLVYLIEKILAPNGYVLNGEVEYQGEERDDNGTIEVKDNVVYLDGTKQGIDESIRPDVVLILDGLEPSLPMNEMKLLGE